MPASTIRRCWTCPIPTTSRRKRRIAAAPLQRVVRRIRVCAGQWFMRRIQTWGEFERTVNFFVDTADTYHSHFLVLPELFTAQLFSLMPSDLDSRDAIRRLASMTDRYIDLFSSLAQKHGLYIIAGSQPVMRDGDLYNVAHLFTPTGDVYTQDALHIPPIERADFDIEPGDDIKVFDTPLGRIAIQVGYDVEFPELARLQTLAGAEVLFVPVQHGRTQGLRPHSYHGPGACGGELHLCRDCRQCRQPADGEELSDQLRPGGRFYAQRFCLPAHATAGESEANVETVLITDLDLTALAQQRDVASVRHLYDRRSDLYDVRAKRAVKVIRTE